MSDFTPTCSSQAQYTLVSRQIDLPPPPPFPFKMEMNQHGRRRWKKTRNWRESSKTFKRFSKYASWFTVIIHNNAYYYILSKYEVLGGVFCLPHHKAMIFFPTKKWITFIYNKNAASLNGGKSIAFFLFINFCADIFQNLEYPYSFPSFLNHHDGYFLF